MILEKIISQIANILLLSEKDINILKLIIQSCRQKKYADIHDIRAFTERGFPVFKFLKPMFYEIEQIENMSGAIIDKKVPYEDFILAISCSFDEIKNNIST